MSIGHLFNKNRVAMSVIAFIVINALAGTLLSFLPSWDTFDPFASGPRHLTVPVGEQVVQSLEYLPEGLCIPWEDQEPFASGLRGMDLFQRAIWTAIGTELVHSAVYFIGTEFILRKKLNLE